MATVSYSVHKCLDEHVQPQTWGHDIPFDSTNTNVSLLPPGGDGVPPELGEPSFAGFCC